MQTWDVFSRLMAERIIYLGEGINSDVANILQHNCCILIVLV